LSRDFAQGSIERMRRKAMLASAGLAATAICFAGLLMVVAGPIEHLLFGGKYAAFAWLIPVLALMPVADAGASGFLMALRASQKPQFDLIANAVAAPVGLLSAVFFMHWWGLAGAAFSLVAGCAASALANFCSYRYFTARASNAAGASAVAQPALLSGNRP
jgi:O-antigen/teichoic acid export membrane protein